MSHNRSALPCTRGGAFSMSGKLLDAADVRRALTRIAHEIVERDKGAERPGAGRHRQPRRPPRAAARGARSPRSRARTSRSASWTSRSTATTSDSRPRRREVHETRIAFDITGKTVVLVDDVLFTGRTIRAAMDALMDFGRPRADPAGGAGGSRAPGAADPRRLRGQERPDPAAATTCACAWRSCDGEDAVCGGGAHMNEAPAVDARCLRRGHRPDPRYGRVLPRGRGRA